MAEAYTPGLSVLESTHISKKRILPIDGEVTVKKGNKVKFDTVVATAKLPGTVHSINVVNALGITAGEIAKYLNFKVGQTINKNDVLAESKPLFGIRFFKTEIKSPIAGTIENISSITGQVLVREPPRLINLSAYTSGTVTEVFEKQGVLVETDCSYIQGIFGIGGENFGQIFCSIDSPKQILDPALITDQCKNKIIVTGAVASKEHIQRAIEFEAKGIIAGGIYDLDLKEILGYEIGVAITGNENIPISVVVTEGFGEMPIANKTFNLLKQNNSKECAINGTTQIRAGVQRPEIIIPKTLESSISPISEIKKLEIGTSVRIIREPYFGVIGTISSIIDEPQAIETGSIIRIVKVIIANDTEVIVPRCNIEII